MAEAGSRIAHGEVAVVALWQNNLSIGSGAVAAALVVSAQGLFALTDSFAPFVADGMSIWQFQAIRAALMLPVAFTVAVMFGSWQRILPRSPGPVALRTALNVVALGAYFAVLPVLPFGQAAAGFFTTPIWVVVCLSMMRGGTSDRRMWLTVALGFAGAALAVGVGGEIDPLALVPVAAGGLNALSILVTNRHCRDEDVCALLFWSIAGFLALGLAGVAVVVSIWAPVWRRARSARCCSCSRPQWGRRCCCWRQHSASPRSSAPGS